MTPQNNINGIKNIVHISTKHDEHCQLCNDYRVLASFDFAVNHYIEKHGYKLLHLGSETHRQESSGDIFNCTIAVLGK